MLIADFIRALCAFRGADQRMTKPDTCDTVKFGDVSGTVSKVAISMFATVDVIRQVAEWGAELLIVHEPMWHIHTEECQLDWEVHRRKKELLEQTGLTVFRYHDHPHALADDLIDCGTIRFSGLSGALTGKLGYAVTGFRLDTPLTALELGRILRCSLNAANLRIAGAAAVPARNLAFACGTPPYYVYDLLRRPDIELIITGEIGECYGGEFARDYAQLGGGKAVLVLGHCVSERCGMRYVAELLSQKFSVPEIRYFECGDVYFSTEPDIVFTNSGQL